MKLEYIIFLLILLVGAAAQDTDSDGMPDGWEKKNGLQFDVDDSDGNLDDDSFTNLEEFKQGTDPAVFDEPSSIFYTLAPFVPIAGIALTVLILAFIVFWALRQFFMKKSRIRTFPENHIDMIKEIKMPQQPVYTKKPYQEVLQPPSQVGQPPQLDRKKDTYSKIDKIFKN